MIRHRVANLCLIDHNFKNPNFLIFNRNSLKLSLTCFSHFSTPIKTNLISGWTSPLRYRLKMARQVYFSEGKWDVLRIRSSHCKTFFGS